MLCSLGTGLNGGFGSDVCEDDGSRDAGPAAPLNPRSPEVDFFLGLDFDLADMGSRVITRALGAGRGAMSILSMRISRLSQDIEGVMVVGRVRVDVIMYDIVPRSNYKTPLETDTVSKIREGGGIGQDRR